MIRALLAALLLTACEPSVTRPAPEPPCTDAGFLAPCSTDAGAGTCQGGACCSGCWAGPTCREPGNLACGARGSLCEPCDGAEACIEGTCKLGPP